MTANLDSVKTALPERAYHHGALRAALLSSAEALIEERGLDHFSLRETARRAGVSPAAPAHHFGDTRGLLTAIATKGFRALGDALELAANTGQDRHARVMAQGAAYVRFALARPARFNLMWRKALLDPDNELLDTAGSRAFAMLDKVVRGENAGRSGPCDPAQAPAIAAWSMVHGFALLALDGAFGADDGAAEQAVAELLAPVLGHLRV